MQTKMRAMKSVADVEVDLKASEGGVLATLPYNTLLTAKGYGYQAMTTTAVAALVVRPSTVPLMSIYNGEAGGGKLYIIERAFAHCLVSTTAQGFGGIWLCVHPVGMTALASVVVTTKNTRGIATYGGNAKIDDDTAIIDDGWFPYGVSGEVEATGVLPGTLLHADIKGKIILPPAAGISITVVSSVVGEEYVVGLEWYEVPQSELGLG